MSDANDNSKPTECQSLNKAANLKKVLNECFENISIGKRIEAELRRQKRTVVWLAKQLKCDRRNVYDIFSRTSIDCNLLMELSLILNTNFIKIYSQSTDEILREVRSAAADPSCS